jgi:hypothetical protein
MERDAQLWKKLWATKAPGKMKITMWRYAQDRLPNGNQLQVRHVSASADCFFCGKHEMM